MALFQNIDLVAFAGSVDWVDLLRVLIVALLSFFGLRVTVLLIRRVLRRRTTAQVSMLVTKAVSYTGVAVIVGFVLASLGVNLAPILGAAGIVGLAIGIASQASLSNVISGVFLISEKPFEVGDVIRTAETTGVVVSIDLLSVKIRTFDNLFIRVPNEKLAGSQLTNITRYPIRRMDVVLQVDFDADLARLKELLLAMAAGNSACLQEPAPIVLPLEFTDFGVKVLFGVWFLKADLVEVRNSIYAAILRELPANGIRFAVPRRAINPAGGADAFAIRVYDPAADPTTTPGTGAPEPPTPQ